MNIDEIFKDKGVEIIEKKNFLRLNLKYKYDLFNVIYLVFNEFYKGFFVVIIVKEVSGLLFDNVVCVLELIVLEC